MPVYDGDRKYSDSLSALADYSSIQILIYVRSKKMRHNL